MRETKPSEVPVPFRRRCFLRKVKCGIQPSGFAKNPQPDLLAIYLELLKNNMGVSKIEEFIIVCIQMGRTNDFDNFALTPNMMLDIGKTIQNVTGLLT